MLLRFFRGTSPAVLIAIILFSIGLWVKSFLANDAHPFHFDDFSMPFYKAVVELVNNNHALGRVISLLLTIGCSLMLLQVSTRFMLIKVRSYIIVLTFAILSSSFLPLQRINPAIFASIFFVLAIDRLFVSYEKEYPYSHFFTAGFYVSIASLFYFPATTFLLFVAISLIILQRAGFREIMVSVFGFLTPWFFWVFYHYFYFDNIQALPSLITSALSFSFVSVNYGIFFTSMHIVFGLTLIISGLFTLRSLGNQKINIRKFYVITFWFWLISTLLAFLSPYSSIEMVYIAAIPASVIMANYLTLSKSKFWPNLLLFLLLATAIVMQVV
jgi:hypothetical protein